MMTLKEVLGEGIVKEVIESFLAEVKQRNPDIAENLEEIAENFATDAEVQELFGKQLADKVALLALSPLDGRYYPIADELREYFSEYALIQYRVCIEVNWLEFLLEDVDDSSLEQRKQIFKENQDYIDGITEDFSISDAMSVKEIEKITKHDVKAVEYFVGEKLRQADLDELVSLVHIGCTSEDITNLAYAMMIKDAKCQVYIPAVNELIDWIESFVERFKNLPMLARTHGQHATPTTLGKEFKVYEKRLKEQIDIIESFCHNVGKFNGATGNYSAISVVFPEQNWLQNNEKFVQFLDLDYNPITTQIESHDEVCRLLEAIKHINMIILNFDIDMWMYIAIDYFKQLVIKGEVGSSTMPHKVNPIKSENSEGNVYPANGLLTGIIEKLLRTRWQRDLSDSTVQRNIGSAIGYSLQVVKEATASLKRYDVNVDVISADLEGSWEVLAEPIQTMLRKYGISDAYEKLKDLTRGKNITQEDIHTFVKGLAILSEQDKKTLLELTPETYTGYAEKIANMK